MSDSMGIHRPFSLAWEHFRVNKWMWMGTVLAAAAAGLVLRILIRGAWSLVSRQYEGAEQVFYQKLSAMIFVDAVVSFIPMFVAFSFASVLVVGAVGERLGQKFDLRVAARLIHLPAVLIASIVLVVSRALVSYAGVNGNPRSAILAEPWLFPAIFFVVTLLGFGFVILATWQLVAPELTVRFGSGILTTITVVFLAPFALGRVVESFETMFVLADATFLVEVAPLITMVILVVVYPILLMTWAFGARTQASGRS